MKYSELLDKIAKFRINIEAAKEADLIDNNADINDFEIMFADSDGNEIDINDVQLDIMGEPYRVMFVENDD